ncbi:MAG: DUF2027 domain-containing protein [Muribaculaceae bacterium]|nr:DUF2027 domain-containing protein [Muribaculaceae bacterium]
MANKKLRIGDTVRFLNDIGGGRVTRIEGNLAYVDDDGFETPVLQSECVVVGAAEAAIVSSAEKIASPVQSSEPAATRLPIIETTDGDSLNIVLGFEATDIKALSKSSFEAYLVNDSNYYLYATIAIRSRITTEWTPVFDGLIEPNIQEPVFDIDQASLSGLDRISVQYVAFKRGKDYEAKTPGSIELKVDATKFIRLHCFRPNPYFEAPVISFDITVNDGKPFVPEIDAQALEQGIKQKKQDTRSAKPRKLNTNSNEDTLVVDLHASELIDNVAGLSSADILNMQIDRFSEVMDANLKTPGRKIIFIHGKGEGVLRQAIMKELTHRYKGHDVQDASFREYGFGATQVTIRNVNAARQPNRKK